MKVYLKNLAKKQKIILGVSSASFLVVLCLGIAFACFKVNNKPAETEKQNEKIEAVVEENDPRAYYQI